MLTILFDSTGSEKDLSRILCWLNGSTLQSDDRVDLTVVLAFQISNTLNQSLLPILLQAQKVLSIH